MKNKNDALEIARMYNLWLDECVHVKSINTIRSYEYAMRLYIEFLENIKKVNPGSFCSSIDFASDTIKNWIDWLADKRKCSPQSCNIRLASIRAFLQYLAERDIKYSQLLLESKYIHRRKEKKRKVEGMTVDAIKVLMATPNVNTNTGYRDVVLMAFLYATAARINEVLSIKVSDLKLESDNPHVTIIGKGNKIRTLYLPPKLVINIKKYLKKFHVNITCDNDRFLFYSRIKGYNNKICPETINKQLKKYAVIAHRNCSDIPLNLHAHLFRHTKASHLLNDGMNIVQLSKMLGHASLATTMIYLDITIDMKTKAIITLEDENTRNLPRKWHDGNNKLTSIFNLKKNK